LGGQGVATAQFTQKELVMGEKWHVLLVDDDPDFIESNSMVLKASGFEVSTASSGAEGLEKAANEKPDIIILDVMMESTDEGFAVARTLRKKLNLTTPIIMLTSVGQVTGYDYKPEEHPDFFPVDAYLEKPVPPTLLVNKIRSLLKPEVV
jgi:DNA-binding response OmpR family regulator